MDAAYPILEFDLDHGLISPKGTNACRDVPEHCVVPGTQLPAHAPFTQAELAHATGGLKLPLALQVWMPLPMHCVAPGTQLPAHAPLTQAELVHAAAVPNAPLALHV